MIKKKKEWRLFLIVLLVFLCASGIIARLFSLQVIKHNFYSALAKSQHQLFKNLVPERGEIYFYSAQDNSYLPAAINRRLYLVYVVPRSLSKKDNLEEIADKLANLLSLDKDYILERLKKHNDPYEPLKHKVEHETVKEIEKLKLPGVGFSPEIERYYPFGKLAAQVIGFLGYKQDKKVGQYGLENYYESELKGTPGYILADKDTRGFWISVGDFKIQPAKNGDDLYLTIDENIQYIIEKELSEAVEKWSADSGTIIVMDPQTGAIKGLANWPTFNLNNYSQVEDISWYLNSAIQSFFEPGSVFKPITMAAALNEGKITPQTTYNDLGRIKIGGYIISNVDGKSYHHQTMTQVLEKSLNTGAVFVEQCLKKEVFREYVKKFGFGQQLGIDLSGEVKGDISNLDVFRDINFATASFGQGIAVTPLQMISAFSAIANGGKLMRPFVVQKIVHNDGSFIETKPKIIRQVISERTANQLNAMLISVVENGYGRPARIKKYYIAGKTGTAQVPDLEKGGYSDKTIHTFIGFGPAFNPKFVILVKLDNPKGIRFAADSVSPVFKRIAEYLLNYYNIPPERE